MTKRPGTPFVHLAYYISKTGSVKREMMELDICVGGVFGLINADHFHIDLQFCSNFSLFTIICAKYKNVGIYEFEE